MSDQVAIHTEVSQAEACIVVPCEIEPLSDAISFLIKQPSLRKRMGQSGKRVANEKLHINQTASDLLAKYRNYILK